MLCLRHFAVSARGSGPECVLLTGVHARERDLAEALSNTCRLPVQLDDETGAVAALQAGLPGLLHGASGPTTGWTIAAGLSLRSLERPQRRHAA